METDINAASSYAAANSITDMYNAVGGDFADAGELERLLSNAFRQFQQTAGSNNSSLQNEALPNPFEPITKDSTTPLRQDMPFNVPFAQQAAGLQLPESSLKNIQQPLKAITAKYGSIDQMPQKNILFEACTINQPLNAALREKYSTGSYYFLPNSV